MKDFFGEKVSQTKQRLIEETKKNPAVKKSARRHYFPASQAIKNKMK